MTSQLVRYGLQIVILAVCLAVAAGCSIGKHRDAGAMTRHVLQHGGLEREYFVYLPTTYDGERRFPALVFLHGYGGSATGTEAEVTHGLSRYAERFGYIVIYPQSTWFMAGDESATRWEVSSWNHISDGFDSGPTGPICSADAVKYPCPPECGTCGQCGWASCNDDVGFLNALVDTVSDELLLESDGVFVAGFSNGAMMANRIACEASHRFAGVALVGGRVEPGFECTPSRPLPLLQINGDQDEVVPADGSASASGYFYAATQAVAESWTAAQSCQGGRREWLSATAAAGAACSVMCGETRAPAIDCLWAGGDHRWPGTRGTIGSNGYCVTESQAGSMPDQAVCVVPDPDAAIWGSQLMFEFFDERRGD